MNPSLYNLDSSKYSLGNLAGAFRPIKLQDTERQLDIVKLMEDIKTPVAPDVKLPDPLDAKVISDYEAAAAKFKDYQNTTANYLRQMNAASAAARYAVGIDYVNAGMAYNSAKSAWQKALAAQNAYEKDVLAPLKAPIEAYNTAVGAVKDKVDAYNADVKFYNKTRDERVSNFNAALQSKADRLVQQRSNIETAGEQLGATSLYSDDLHNLMLSSMAAKSEEEAAPAHDNVLSLFSGVK